MKRILSISIVMVMVLSFTLGVMAADFKEVTVTKENGRWGYTGLAIILGVSVPNFVAWNPELKEMKNPNLITPGMKFRYQAYDSVEFTESMLNDRIGQLGSAMSAIVKNSEQGLRKDIADLDERIAKRIQEITIEDPMLTFEAIVTRLENKVDEIADELTAVEDRTAMRINTAILQADNRIDQVDKTIKELKEKIDSFDVDVTLVESGAESSVGLTEKFNQSVRAFGMLLTGVKAESKKNGMLLGLAVIILILVAIALVAMAFVRIFRPKVRQKTQFVELEPVASDKGVKPFVTNPFDIRGVKYVYKPEIINGVEDGKLVCAVAFNSGDKGEFKIGYRNVLNTNARRSIKNNLNKSPELVEHEIKKGRLIRV